MVEHTKKWLGLRVPSGWDDIAVGALKTMVVGFLALAAWDWFESSDWDPAGVGSNAVVVAVGLFVIDALVMRAGKRAGSDLGGGR